MLAGRDVGIVYGLLVVTIAVVVAGQSPGERHTIVAVGTATVANLRRRPLTVLVVSAFVVSPLGGLAVVVTLVWAYGRVQRWLGRASAVLIGVLGHVGATLFVATLQASALVRDRVGVGVSRGAEVGVSYGVAAVCGVLVAAVNVHRRRYVVISIVVLAGQLLLLRGFTAFGHIVAWLLGVAVAVVLAHVPPDPAPPALIRLPPR